MDLFGRSGVKEPHPPTAATTTAKLGRFLPKILLLWKIVMDGRVGLRCVEELWVDQLCPRDGLMEGKMR
jgi:hypothetical protein